MYERLQRARARVFVLRRFYICILGIEKRRLQLACSHNIHSFACWLVSPKRRTWTRATCLLYVMIVPNVFSERSFSATSQRIVGKVNVTPSVVFAGFWNILLASGLFLFRNAILQK